MEGLKISGENNTVVLVKNGMEVPFEPISGLSITITGNNNIVKIGVPSKFIGTTVVMNGDNNFFSIKPTRHRFIRHTNFGMENGGIITIGGGISVYRALNMVAKENKKIEVGDECMFAREIIIRNNDGHTIIDTTTKEVINAPDDITLEDRVWVGTRAMILKGAYISEGSIVGAMSLVNKKFKDKNIIIAGNPAKKVREGVTWDRADYHNYMKNLEDV